MIRQDWPEGHEKAPTTPVAAVIIRGVKITSRYQKQHELELMARVVSALPTPQLTGLASLWCDSKATASYIAEMKPGFDREELTFPLVAELSRQFRRLDGGHNDINVGETVTADPVWLADQS